jgi:hypothetical protein
MFWKIAMSLWNIPIVPLHLLKLSLKLLYLLYFYGEGTLQYIACLLSAYFLVLCGYFDFVNNQILSLGFFERKETKKIQN